MRISDWSSDVCSSDLDRIWVIAYPRSKGLSGPILQRNALPLTAPPKLTQLGDLAIQSGANWPDHPGDIRVGDGVSKWTHRLKQCGNAVVPQIPEILVRAILARSEERSVGNEGVSTGRSRGWQNH